MGFRRRRTAFPRFALSDIATLLGAPQRPSGRAIPPIARELPEARA